MTNLNSWPSEVKNPDPFPQLRSCEDVTRRACDDRYDRMMASRRCSATPHLKRAVRIGALSVTQP